MRKLFGTDGIRGKANVFPMTGDVAFKLGRAVTFYFQKENSLHKPTIIIGKDTRLSCYMLEQAFASGVCSQGGRAILTGPLPTPGVAFVVQSMRANAGVMISASHNSFEDNGIKIFNRTGEKLSDDIELQLENMILNPEILPVKTGSELGNAKRLDQVVDRYIVQVKSCFNSQDNLEGMRVILDCANGASYKIAPMAFQELGAEVFCLGVSPNGMNINHKCGALYPERCSEEVKKMRADFGICYDGDADRLIMVDEQAEIVHGDRLIALLAKYLVDIGEMPSKEVVGTVMTNLGVEKYLEKQGLSLFRSKVGDRYIKERMSHSGATFGGEPSGHLIFKNYATTGDGILASLKVIECVRYYKKPLSELVKDIPLYPQILKNIIVTNKKPIDSLPLVMKAQQEVEKELGDHGRVLLRYSGTEPKLRIMIESDGDFNLNEMADKIAAAFKESGL